MTIEPLTEADAQNAEAERITQWLEQGEQHEMNNNLQMISKVQQTLQFATKPEQSQAVEAGSLASMAWAKERGDYELFVKSWYVYVLARRKTTELIQPHIRQGQYGREPDIDVKFISDFGFTYKQWNRRSHELEISLETINQYFDEIVANYDWHPSLAGLVKYSGAHVSHNSGEQEWYTPTEYIAAARKVMGEIDLDPASSDRANQTVCAKRYYTKEENGLVQEWGGRVWMNPPYAVELIGKFVRKLVDGVTGGAVQEAIVLVNNATETEWFDNLISIASAVVFPKGRIRFIDQNGNPSGAPLQGQAFVYAGGNPKKFMAEFEQFGWGAIL